MSFHRKYGTLLVTGTTSIRIPIIKRAAVDFAVGADWTPAAGDVKVFVDAAVAANITNLPTAIASGNGAFWEFIITAAELTCKQLLVVVSDAATKAVEDQSFIVETYGNASAMYVTDFSAQLATPTNITAATGVVLSGVTHTGAVIPTVSAVTGLTAATVHSDLDDIQARLPAALTAGGNIKADALAWNGLATVALPATPTNITAATGIVLSGVTHTGAVIPTVSVLTGHTAQTGDNFARIGATGSGLTSLATQASVNAVDDFVDTEIADIQARLPAALVGGRMDSSTGAMAADVITAASMAATAGQEIADSILLRNLDRTGSGTDLVNERTVVNALRAIRNKASIAAGTLTVTKEDDITTAWTAAVTTAAGDPLSGIDPA